jgi:STE24 endopeptidase
MNQTPIYSESEQTQAKQYARIRLKLTLLSTLLSFVILAVFNFTPLSQFLAHLSKQANADWKIQTAIFFILFSIIFYIAEFPLHFFSSFTLEHRFQLSNQSLAQWIREELKRQFLSFVLVLTLVVTLYAVMRTTGNQW